MIRRRYLDPRTGDHALERGSPKPDTTIVSEVVRALRTRRGSSAVLPDYGSRLHEIRYIAADTTRRALGYVREALRELIERGEVADLAVQATADGSVLLVAISFRDRAGTRRAVEYSHRVI